jgi:hypothetical protein
MTPPRPDEIAPAQRWTRQNLADRASELLASLDSQMTILRGGSDEARRIADELRTLVEEVRQALETASTSQA